MIIKLLLHVYKLLPSRLQEIASWLLASKMTVGVCVAAFDPENRILLFRHTYHPGGMWTLPGGHLHIGESPEAGLIRELREESGAEVKLISLIDIEVSPHWPGHMTLYYLADLLHPPKYSSAEVEAWDLFSLNELPARILPEARRVIARAQEFINTHHDKKSNEAKV
ncbi:NUDIX hydrolase [Thermobaculum terrenum ATCC BAA-798]|uniref:NUDIX hydrolase n=1 Tax=Thermobaculum terrenum (strain ATCC BAA-798 / CCMEE 7001 / YNP1) TaxID=525904 RepID=D1CF30_THET1|nr:NUDIX hydrolase [Thermobaculum terrenum ATCC BAA-798]